MNPRVPCFLTSHLASVLVALSLSAGPILAQGPTAGARQASDRQASDRQASDRQASDRAAEAFNPHQVARIESLISAAIQEGKLPGCVLTVGRHDQVLLSRAFGHRQLVPAPQPMTDDTIFDLASLTKPIATGTSVMLLIERGQLQVTDRVAQHWPEFGTRGKELLTLFDLLTHQSGLIADNPLADYEQGPDEAWRKICDLPLRTPPRTKFVYSDVNFLVLGKLVERVTGETLAAFSVREVFEPLGMSHTRFVPPPEWRPRIAPTGQRGDRWLIGEVHDPRAHLLGGVAGHAGLFSTATDLALFAQMLLQGGQSRGRQILSQQSVTQMIGGHVVPTLPGPSPRPEVQPGARDSETVRGLGWDRQSRYSHNRGQGWSDAAFGHGGFTGTVLWIDPDRDLFFVFLSNRLHPTGKGDVNRLAGEIGTIIAELGRPEN
ncbi:MAG: serine hydrolase domain-containing protein [Planctomycetaceae bacterium]